MFSESCWCKIYTQLPPHETATVSAQFYRKMLEKRSLMCARLVTRRSLLVVREKKPTDNSDIEANDELHDARVARYDGDGFGRVSFAKYQKKLHAAFEKYSGNRTSNSTRNGYWSTIWNRISLKNTGKKTINIKTGIIIHGIVYRCVFCFNGVFR